MYLIEGFLIHSLFLCGRDREGCNAQWSHGLLVKRRFFPLYTASVSGLRLASAERTWCSILSLSVHDTQYLSPSMRVNVVRGINFLIAYSLPSQSSSRLSGKQEVNREAHGQAVNDRLAALARRD